MVKRTKKLSKSANAPTTKRRGRPPKTKLSKSVPVSVKSTKKEVRKSEKKVPKVKQPTQKKKLLNNFISIEFPCFFTTIKSLILLKKTNLILISSLDTIALISYDINTKTFKVESDGFLQNEKIDKIIELENGNIAVAGENHLNIYSIINKHLNHLFYHRYQNPLHTVDIFETKNGEIVNCKVNGITKFGFINNRYSLISESRQIDSKLFYEIYFDSNANKVSLFYLDDIYQYDLGNLQSNKKLKLQKVKFSKDKDKSINYKVIKYQDKFIYFYENCVNLFDNNFKLISSFKVENDISYFKVIEEKKFAFGDKAGTFYIYELDTKNQWNNLFKYKFGDTSLLAINKLSKSRLIINVDHNRFAIFDYEKNMIELIQAVKDAKNMRKGILLEDGAYLTGCCNGFIFVY